MNGRGGGGGLWNGEGTDPMRWWRTPLDAARIIRPTGRVRVETSWCKGCRFCVEYCPRHVLELSTDFNARGYHYPTVRHPDACVDCKLCERLCPEFAIVSVSAPS